MSTEAPHSPNQPPRLRARRIMQAIGPDSLTNILAFAVLAACIAFTLLIHTKRQEQVYQEYARQGIQQFADEAALAVSERVSHATGSIRSIADLLSAGLTGPELADPAKAIAPLGKTAPFSAIEYVDARGRNLMNIAEPFDASDRIYFIEGIKGKTGIWENLNPKFSREPLVNFYTPLLYQGKPIGVVTGYIRAKTQLSGWLKAQFMDVATIGLIVDDQNMVIAHTLETESEHTKNLTLAALLAHQNINEQEQATILNLLSSTDSAILYNGWTGKGALCAERIPGTGWKVVTVIPSASFRELAPQSHNQILYTYLIIAALTALYMVFIIYRRSKEQQEYLRRTRELEEENRAVNEENQKAFAELSDTNYILQEKQFQLEEITFQQEAQLKEITSLNATLTAQKEDLHAKQLQLAELNCEQEAQLAEITSLNATLTARQEDLRAKQQELQAARDAADEANQAKTRFLFNMSHDIRTPMNAIIGFTDLAVKYHREPPRLLDCLAKIKDSGVILLSIINNVLSLARIEKEAAHLEERVWNLEETDKIYQNLFSEMMERKGLAFTIEKNCPHPYILCDPVKLQEIFINIISNAYKYTEKGGSVRLTVEQLPNEREGWCTLRSTVRDTGIGMSPEYLPKLFDEFSREHTSTENTIEGTGLGMPIVKRLVELMGGNIQVESALGQGTTFTVSIPHRLATKAETPDVPDNQPADFKGNRLLLAEDNDLNAEIATELLQEAGFILERAENGQQAVEMLSDNPPGYYDAILMDVQMPVMNGYEATRAIRALPDKERSAIPIIAMTANAFAEDKQDAYDAGMNGHVAKPVNVKLLMDELAKVLR